MKNIKPLSFLLLMLLFIQLFSVGCAPGRGEEKSAAAGAGRKIYTGCEIGINYVTHIYTLANAGFEDSEYVKKYGNTISKEDIAFLKKNADAMKFFHRTGGKLKTQLYFLPALNNFQEEEAWRRYFSAWEKAIEERSFDAVEPYCTGLFHEQVSSFFENVRDEQWKESVLKELPLFKKIGEIYIRNFETYKAKVWPEVEPILKKRSGDLNKRLSDIPYVNKWEAVTGYQFGDYDYYIALYYAGEHGPSFNNVSLNKNTAYYNSETDYMLDMFSHELGIHIMLPHIYKLSDGFLESGVPVDVIYRAGETLASFYNEKVLGRPENNNFDKQFMDIYSKLSQEGVSSPRELYERGIKAYRAGSIDGYPVSRSQDGEKEIYCIEDGKLVLVFDNSEKVIYENYRAITSNPYSVWDMDEYKIQWSEDSNYVYIIDSIYDFKNDRLMPLKDCVIFSWIGNKGIYLAEGTYYEISYDGALQNEMAAGKKIKMIEGGAVKELGEQIGDRYFVLDDCIQEKKAFETIGDYIVINTASLKYSEEQLQDKIKEEFHSSNFQGFLQKNHNDEMHKKLMAAIDRIKELKEFKDLESEIDKAEKSYPVTFEGNIKKLIEIVNDDTYGYYNVSGKYFLKDIKREELRFR